MMRADRKQAIHDALAALALTHAAAIAQLETAMQLLADELDTIPDATTFHANSVALRRHNDLVDRASHSVKWNGKQCFLGNNLLFRFFDRIARSPNQYISYRVLLNDVWRDEREHSSIRGVAKRLRDRLSLQGMPDLSERIDGTNPGHYRLVLF